MADPLDRLYQEPPGSKDTADPDEPDAPITVQVDDDQDADDGDGSDGEPPAAAKPDDRPPRKQRRDNRFREAKERAERAEREAEEARLAAQRAEARAAAFEAQMAAQRHQQQARDPNADYKTKRAEIRDKQERIRRQFESMSEEEQVSLRAKMQAEIDDLDEEILELRQRRQPAPNQGQMAAQVQEAIFRAKHHDVLGDPKGESRARSHFIRMVGVDGKPKTLATFEDAIALAREEMGGAKRTAGERSRFSGVAARGNGASSVKKPSEIRMGPHERAMAREAYSHLPEDQAYKKWANDMARRMVEE